jgi:hypothetical protein
VNPMDDGDEGDKSLFVEVGLKDYPMV